jgi:hypothetical protein
MTIEIPENPDLLLDLFMTRLGAFSENRGIEWLDVPAFRVSMEYVLLYLVLEEKLDKVVIDEIMARFDNLDEILFSLINN